MTAPVDVDPVAAYTAVLGATLRGPRRAKERMLAEIGEGLRDAAEPYRAAGSDLATAVDRAADEFGRPHDLAPDCQRELTIRQTRTTAARLVLCVPLLLVAWHLLWIGAAGGVWRLVAMPLATVTTLGALHAAAVLLVTGRFGRRLPTPPRLPVVTAWTASVVAVALLLTTASVVAGVVGVTGAPALAPLLIVVAVAVVGHVVVARSGRTCRRCWELDRTGPGVVEAE